MAGSRQELARSQRDQAESRQDLAESRQDLTESHRDQSISRLIGLKLPAKRSHRRKRTTFPDVMRSDRFFSVFYYQTRQPTRRSRVLGSATRRRPVTGVRSAGWVGWRVDLDTPNYESANIFLFLFLNFKNNV